jgi:hypothetical protein
MSATLKKEFGYLVHGEGVEQLSSTQLGVALGRIGVQKDVEFDYVQLGQRIEITDEPEISPTDPRYIAYTDLSLYTNENWELLITEYEVDPESYLISDLWDVLHELPEVWAKDTQDVNTTEGKTTHEFAIRKDESIRELKRCVDRDYRGMHGEGAGVYRVIAFNLFTVKEMLEHFSSLPEGTKLMLDEERHPMNQNVLLKVLYKFVKDKIRESRELSLAPL